VKDSESYRDKGAGDLRARAYGIAAAGIAFAALFLTLSFSVAAARSQPNDKAASGPLVAALTSHSALGARAVEAVPAGCTELLLNGGFESGGLGWAQYSAQGSELVSDFNPRTGSLGAYLGGLNNADDRLSQEVALPLSASSISLHAWWYLDTAETAGTFDTMTVSLLRPDGTVLTSLLTVDNTAPAGVWDEILLDLTGYAGQTVHVQLAARTDADNISDFYLDDVSLVACSGSWQTFLPHITK
jgi:hypothetical protein